ncbi:uncharacterized protein LOC110840866 [Zootermopsis nevadensis]|uniref:uncharacterized protein LOC110840866 n=1 Tax=Zootermopsis nevadensis TaxID=136037 RepID=UPI000B8EB1AA|nr:uncharacterized protein LOC110840866 [Zootermopsis nevadensis]
MSGEKYATASLIIPLAIGLKNVCNILLKKSFCKEVQQVIQCYLRSIQERFGSLGQSTTLMVCTFIDPRFKMLAFSDKQISENAKQKVIALVTSKVNHNVDTTPHSATVTTDADELCVWNYIDISATRNPPRIGRAT